MFPARSSVNDSSAKPRPSPRLTISESRSRHGRIGDGGRGDCHRLLRADRGGCPAGEMTLTLGFTHSIHGLTPKVRPVGMAACSATYLLSLRAARKEVRFVHRAPAGHLDEPWFIGHRSVR